MKARRVTGLDPEDPLAENLGRIVRARADELWSFMPQASDPREVQALHDLRIAAKRLRYILEMSSDCFGPYAASAAKRAKEVQDLVGEIHDCDVTLPRVQELLAQARADDVEAILARVPEGADDLDPALAGDAPHATAYRGLETLCAFLEARRRLLFARFLQLWTDLERTGFRARLDFALQERPGTEVTSSSPGDDIVPLASEEHA